MSETADCPADNTQFEPVENIWIQQKYLHKQRMTAAPAPAQTLLLDFTLGPEAELGSCEARVAEAFSELLGGPGLRLEHRHAGIRAQHLAARVEFFHY